MGLLGDLLAQGFSAICGEETGEVFIGNGTSDQKDLFEKILGRWNEIFSRNDFLKNSTSYILREPLKLPAYFQLMSIGYPDHDDGNYEKALSNAFKDIIQIRFGDETIDFAFLNELLTCSEYISSRDYTTSCRTNVIHRPFYYFRYKKNKDLLTFLYEPYMELRGEGLKTCLKVTDQDELTLGTQIGEEFVETSVRWQPQPSWDSVGSTPEGFFKKLNRNDVYINLKHFMDNLTSCESNARKLNYDQDWLVKNKDKYIQVKNEADKSLFYDLLDKWNDIFQKKWELEKYDENEKTVFFKADKACIKFDADVKFFQNPEKIVKNRNINSFKKDFKYYPDKESNPEKFLRFYLNGKDNSFTLTVNSESISNELKTDAKLGCSDTPYFISFKEACREIFQRPQLNKNMTECTLEFAKKMVNEWSRLNQEKKERKEKIRQEEKARQQKLEQEEKERKLKLEQEEIKKTQEARSEIADW